MVPSFAHASVIFTEVMYDLPGTDTGREWVEVCNTESAAVVLSEWRFHEADTDHKIVAVDTSANGGTLTGGQCAVIADNTASFRADNSGYTGKLFDSSFSLTNVGETLVLRNADLVDMDTLTYEVSLGAAGDGNTLSKGASNGWVVSGPNPGVWHATNLTAPVLSGDDTEDATTPASVSTGIAPTVYAYLGKDRIVLVGAKNLFEGQATNTAKKLIDGADYVWNFGDGTVRYGRNVYHTYQYPGTYIVHLTATEGGAHGESECKVTVRPADVSISNVGIGIAEPYIELENRSTDTIDLSFWYLRAQGKLFQIPEYTRLPGKTAVRFLASATGLRPSLPEQVELMYPNMTLMKAYQESLVPAASTSTIVEPFPQTQIAQAVRAVSAPVTKTASSVASSVAATATRIAHLSPDPAVSEIRVASEEHLAGVADADTSMIPSVHSAVVASAAATGSPERSFWFLALGGIIILGIAGVVIARGGEDSRLIEQGRTGVACESDEYDILEDR